MFGTTRNNPSGVSYTDLYNICVHHFGDARHSGGSHAIFRTSWQGDPRVNIQNDKGKAKPYQVRQVLAAIDRLDENRGES